MYEIHVSVEIEAHIDRVFDALSDHEHFLRGGGIRSARLRQEGRTERNGMGALREVAVGSNRFLEEVVRFDRPGRFDYVIRSATWRGLPLPIKHELGWLELEATEAKTRVDWRSRSQVTVPLLGSTIEHSQGEQFAELFRQLVAQTKAELEE